MTPGDVAASLARLRRAGEALRRRPAQSVHLSLGRVLEGFGSQGPWRRELEAKLPGATGFSPETVRAGLELALADWSAEALHATCRRELAGAPDVQGFDITAVVLAGSLPMPTLLALLAPLALRSPVLAKCASRDPVTGPLLARALHDTDPELGDCLDVAHFPGDDEACTRALLEADCVLATGSDATLAALRRELPPGRRLVAHGHRVSIAVIGNELPDPEATARALALDVALWDQLGCLSPVAIHCEGDALADRMAGALAQALADLAERMPRGEVSDQALAAISHERAEAELRAAAGNRVSVLGSDDFSVLREADGTPRPAPLHRFVRVCPFDSPDALARALSPVGRWLAASALAGFGSRTLQLSRLLARLGASRVCAPGRMQAPPLGWHHENQPWLTPLARFTDCEVPG